MDIIVTVFEKLKEQDPNMLLAIAAIGGLFYFAQSIITSLFGFIKKILRRIFTRQIQFHYSHTLSNKFNIWFSDNHHKSKFCKSFKSQQVGREEVLLPGYSKAYFFLKGLPVFYVHRESVKSKNIYEETDVINITIFSLFKKSVKKIYDMINDVDTDVDGGRKVLKLYKQSSDGYCWEYVGKLRKVITPPNECLKDLYDDIQTFEDLKPLYSKKGIPHKRGYCLYGEPGTGKTSLVLHLAHKYEKNVYVLEKHSNGIENLLAYIKPGSILLVEDIDLSPLAGKKRSLEEYEGGDCDEGDTPLIKKESTIDMNSMSLRKTLNVLDGVYSPNDIIFICTTNKKDALDDALLRPGRIDKQIHITKLNPKEQEKFFNSFYDTNETGVSLSRGITMSEYTDILKRHLDSPQNAKKYISNLENTNELT